MTKTISGLEARIELQKALLKAAEEEEDSAGEQQEGQQQLLKAIQEELRTISSRLELLCNLQKEALDRQNRQTTLKG